MILGNGKYQVLPDGIIINNDTGAIMRPLETRKGKKAKPHYLLKLDNNKSQWYSVEWLIKHYHELNELEVPEEPIPLENEDDAVSFHTIDSSKGFVKSVMDLLDD
jgi:hypothetical protein